MAVDAVTVLGHCWPPGCRQRASATRPEAQWVLSGTGLTGPSVPVPVGAACYPLWNEPKGVPGVPVPVGHCGCAGRGPLSIMERLGQPPSDSVRQPDRLG